MKLSPYLRKLIRIGLLLFVFHLAVIAIGGLNFEAKQADTILILGNQVLPDGTPSKRLRYRLEKGYALYAAKLAPQIIVSGGIGVEGYDEAEVMANYLIARGVPEAAIIRDNQGNNTYLSAQNCLAILQQQDKKSVILVSQYFHLMRARLAFAKMEVPEISAEAADWFWEWRDCYSLSREVLGLYYYLFRS
ncbi:MAG: YdcF family protein, partial [Bacteroidota bacterium]